MNARSIRFSRMIRSLSALALFVCAPFAVAQVPQSPSATLPVSITAAGNHADIVIGASSTPMAEVSLDFQDASGLSAASLGASAKVVDVSDPVLLARLPGSTLTSLTSALPRPSASTQWRSVLAIRASCPAASASASRSHAR